jgi:hypothetical protein
MAGVERLDPDPFARGVSGLEFRAPEAVGGHLRPVHARGGAQLPLPAAPAVRGGGRAQGQAVTESTTPAAAALTASS